MSPDSSTPIADSLRRSLHWLVAATVVLYAATAVFGFLVLRSTATTHHALCTFRADLENRVTQTRVYLIQHPRGFPGIPVATLQKSLADQQRTVDTLAGLDC